MSLQRVIALLFGLVSGVVCFLLRPAHFPPGDFNWAIYTAVDMINGVDPYAFTPNPLKIPYPLPVGLFALPVLALPQAAAASVFFGTSSGLLAFGILRSREYWRLLAFISWPYVYALMMVQWSPLITAAWFLPVLAPLMVLVKPHTALPVALARWSTPGLWLAGIVLCLSLLMYPTWPFRWLAMVGDYQRLFPLLVLPAGPLLLLAVFRWREPRARLILAIAVLPLRGAYDLLLLWLVPSTWWESIVLTLLSWIMGLWGLSTLMEIQPKWVVPALLLPALFFVLRAPFYDRYGTRVQRRSGEADAAAVERVA